MRLLLACASPCPTNWPHSTTGGLVVWCFHGRRLTFHLDMNGLRLVCFSSLIISAVTAPPNVVFILSDDQGYADVSLNPDHPAEISTPNIDALAAEGGVVFSRAYASASICAPSRAGIMLGRYQQRVGVYSDGDGDVGFDPMIPIFPQYLPAAYTSMAIGKWHLGLDGDYPELKWHANQRGFNESFYFMAQGGHDYWQCDNTCIGHGKLYRNNEWVEPTEIEATADDGSGRRRACTALSSETRCHNGMLISNEYLTTRFNTEAVAFINRSVHNRHPFFLYLGYNAVHGPAQAPEETVARYKKRFPRLHDTRVVYLAMLDHLDQGVGAVTQKLKTEGVWENTLLFFLTDNGGASGMHANNGRLKGWKHSLYEGGLRVPFILSWPAHFQEIGRIIATPVSTLDILPTVLEAAAGVGTPPRARTATGASVPFDGKSLLPLLMHKSTTHHEMLFFHCQCAGRRVGRSQWAVVHNRYKLHNAIETARVADESKRLVLTDLIDDPFETTNLAQEKPDIVNHLHQSFVDWSKEMQEAEDGMKHDAGNREIHRHGYRDHVPRCHDVSMSNWRGSLERIRGARFTMHYIDNCDQCGGAWCASFHGGEVLQSTHDLRVESIDELTDRSIVVTNGPVLSALECDSIDTARGWASMVINHGKVFALRFQGITIHYVNTCNLCGRDWCQEIADVSQLTTLEHRVDWMGEGPPLSAQLCNDVDASWASMRTASDLRLYAVRFSPEVTASAQCYGLVLHDVPDCMQCGRDWCAGFARELPTRADFEQRSDFLSFAAAPVGAVCERVDGSWTSARVSRDDTAFAVERVLLDHVGGCTQT